MSNLPVGESRTLETERFDTVFAYSRVEVGACDDGFCDGFVEITVWTWCSIGCCRQIYEDGSLLTDEGLRFCWYFEPTLYHSHLEFQNWGRDTAQFPSRINLFTLLKRGWTKHSFLLVEKEMDPIKINSTYTKNCIDPIKVIISTNRSDGSTNKEKIPKFLSVSSPRFEWQNVYSGYGRACFLVEFSFLWYVRKALSEELKWLV